MLSEEGANLVTHAFTGYTTVFTIPGVYYHPLEFTKIGKPFILYNSTLTKQHVKNY
jgi:hypothetical protein